MTDKYYGLRRRPTFEEMLKEAMTHRLKIEIIPERQVIDLSINNIDFDDFDLSKYDRRLRLNAKVQTDEQVLHHELFPDMFDEVAPTSQLYENNEADAQTTRYIAKDFTDEIYSNAISGRTEEKKKSDEPTDVKDTDLKQSDEKQEDLQSLHLTSSSSASTVKEEEKKEESREIKSLRNIFLGGEDKSVFELFKRDDKKTSTPSEQSREQEEEHPRASFWSRRQVEARSRSHSPEERARDNQMNRRQLETRSRSNSPQEIARGSEWTREQMETRSRSRSPESTNTKSSRGKKKK